MKCAPATAMNTLRYTQCERNRTVKSQLIGLSPFGDGDVATPVTGLPRIG